MFIESHCVPFLEYRKEPIAEATKVQVQCIMSS